jgi:hypothetical protein
MKRAEGKQEIELEIKRRCKLSYFQQIMRCAAWNIQRKYCKTKAKSADLILVG